MVRHLKKQSVHCCHTGGKKKILIENDFVLLIFSESQTLPVFWWMEEKGKSLFAQHSESNLKKRDYVSFINRKINDLASNYSGIFPSLGQ